MKKKLLFAFLFVFVFAPFVGFPGSLPTVHDKDTIIVEGEVLDSESKKPIRATISYERIPTRDDIGIIESDSATGGYLLTLQNFSKYKITIQAPQYITNFELVEFKDNEIPDLLKAVYLVPLKIGQVIVMNRITFEKGKAKLLPESYHELDNIYKMLSEHSAMVIQLEGHTDNAGSAAANLKLSQNRVAAVKEYLMNKGVKKSRIEVMAFGGSKPIENNSTEDGRIKNRRVEIRILKN